MTRRITRREAIKRVGRSATAGVMAAGLGNHARAEASPRRRGRANILFILADDLGYGDLGCYGQKQIQTPHIDRMASEGVRFTQAYAGSTVCAPSRCALMTGLHCGHARIRGNARVPLLPKDHTVAEVLKHAGYATGIIGKWGLGEAGTTGIPNRKGFDEWFGYLNQGNAHNYYPPFLWRNEAKIELKGNGPSYEYYSRDAATHQIGPQGSRRRYSHDLFTTAAIDFVRRHRTEPFFLYLAYTIPHANNELGAVTGDGMEVPDYGPYADRPWPNPQKGYAAMITRMDRDIGKLLATLKELGIDEDTIIFFSSDNGPHREGGADPNFFDSNGPLRGIKRDLYEGGIRVPMIVRWPGKIRAGTVSDRVWAFWDFLPTAADIAGVEPPPNIDGVSILPVLLGRPQRNHDYLYWEFHERGFTQAVRLGDWKAVRFGTREPIELYDLRTDIGERHNLADRHPDVVAKIEAILKTARTESFEFPIRERK